MQTFANKFNIALNQDKSEVIINFFQNIPKIPEVQGTSQVLSEPQADIIPVSNLVMTGQTAQALAETILHLMEQNIAQ